MIEKQVGYFILGLVDRRRDDVAGRFLRQLQDIFAEVGFGDFESGFLECFSQYVGGGIIRRIHGAESQMHGVYLTVFYEKLFRAPYRSAETLIAPAVAPELL